MNKKAGMILLLGLFCIKMANAQIICVDLKKHDTSPLKYSVVISKENNGIRKTDSFPVTKYADNLISQFEIKEKNKPTQSDRYVVLKNTGIYLGFKSLLIGESNKLCHKTLSEKDLGKSFIIPDGETGKISLKVIK